MLGRQSPTALDYSLRRLVSRDTGIVGQVRISSVSPSDPQIWLCTADSVLGESLYAGASLDLASAVRSCLAEAAERYSGGFVCESKMLRETANALTSMGQKIMYPSEDSGNPPPPECGCAKLYLDTFDENSRIGWLKAKTYDQNEDIFVPATLAYLGYSVDGERFQESTSIGLAAAESIDDAKAGALCELIEREAVMITWLCRRRVPRVDVEHLDDKELHSSLGSIRAAGVEIRLFDVTTDIPVPTFLAIARRDRGQPAIALGSASHPNAILARRKAVLECAHMHFTAKMLARRFPSYRPTRSYHEVRTFRDRVLMYSHPSMLKSIDFIWETPERSRLADSSDVNQSAVNTAIPIMKNLGIQAAWLDLTPPDIKLLGLHVVRAVAPGLQPMEAEYCQLQTRRKRLDRWLEQGNKDQLNLLPHPLG